MEAHGSHRSYYISKSAHRKIMSIFIPLLNFENEVKIDDDLSRSPSSAIDNFVCNSIYSQTNHVEKPINIDTYHKKRRRNKQITTNTC